MEAFLQAVNFMARFARDRNASSAVEFALVAPVVLILIFGAIASGVMMYTAVNLQQATETSARCLSANRKEVNGNQECPLDDQTAFTAFALDHYTGPAIEGLTFTPADNDPNCSGYKVTATGTFNFFAGFGVLSIPLGTSACYPGP